MRENKYRGKRLDNEEWIYGSLIIINDNAYIHNGRCFPGEVNFEFNFIEVAPATVGQYTGRKDKNGREIYEGDIMTDKYKSKGVVEWIGGGFFMNFDDVDIFPISDCLDDDYQMWVDGNIHDNPEQLKGNEE